MKILFVSPEFPYPLDTGAKIRTFNLIKNLAERNDVHLLSIAERQLNESDIGKVKAICREVYVVPFDRKNKILQVPGIIRRFIRGEPFMLKYAESRAIARLLQDLTANTYYDIIQFEHSNTASHISHISRGNEAKKVLSFHNVGYAQFYRLYKMERGFLQRLRYAFDWLPMLGWEPRIASQFDKSIVVSDMDYHLLKFLNPGLDIAIIPNGVDTGSYSVYPRSGRDQNILMVGSFDYGPNADAVRFFYNDIFPKIRSRLPATRFIIVGRRPPPDIAALSKDSAVRVCGDVEDVRPFYGQAMVLAVPLRAGGGTRLKILESMATGTPVVSTMIGCEGLNVSNEQTIMMADRPEEFARKVIKLIESEDLWTRLSEAGRNLVKSQYDWKELTGHLERIYLKML